MTGVASFRVLGAGSLVLRLAVVEMRRRMGRTTREILGETPDLLKSFFTSFQRPLPVTQTTYSFMGHSNSFRGNYDKTEVIGVIGILRSCAASKADA